MTEQYDTNRLAQFSSTLAERLRACDSADDLCSMVCAFCHELLPEDAVVVSLLDPERDSITIRNIHGFGNLVDQALRVFATDPRRMTFKAEEMTAPERARYCSGRMELVPDGIFELLARKAPRSVCTAVQRLLRVHSCYVVGFGANDVPRGGLTILRRAPSPPQDTPLIEMLAGMVSLAIRQRRADQERVKLEQQLQQAHKLEAIGQLAGGVAHDYNNTLQCISGIAELMRDDLPAGHPHRAYLADLLAAANNARDLTKKLLTIGRRQRLEMKPTDLVELVGELKRLLDHSLRDDVSVETELDDGPVTIKGDALELKRALINMAINAQDAMPRGGTLRLQVHADSQRQAAQLRVIDTGCGMRPEVARQAFEPFFTTKPPDRGTGLGLATVYGIVEQHGGQIDLESTPGAGTCITINFPMTEEEPAPSPERARPVPVRSDSSAKGWILLADDEAMVREPVAIYLSRSGWQVVEASSGEEALAKCDAMSDPPDLVLSDLSMPGMSGRDLLRLIKARCPQVPTVAMSGYCGDDIALETDASGRGLRFLPKPFSFEELDTLLAELLPGRGSTP